MGKDAGGGVTPAGESEMLFQNNEDSLRNEISLKEDRHPVKGIGFWTHPPN